MFQYKVGQVVVVIREAPLKRGGEVIDKLFRGLPVAVEATQGSLIQVSSIRPGWLDSRHVISVEEAILMWSRFVARDPSAWNYHVRAIAFGASGRLDRALRDIDDAIGLAPSASSYICRANLWFCDGNYEKAIADYTKALSFGTHHAIIHNNRAHALRSNREYDAAIADCNEALRIQPGFLVAFNNRGHARLRNGDYEGALADFREALRIEPSDRYAHDGCARLWATCEDDQYRNGEGAVDFATKAIDRTNSLGTLATGDKWTFYDTLAAAHAENGTFADAIKSQKLALDYVTNAHDQREASARLVMYRQDRPYRHVPKT